MGCFIFITGYTVAVSLLTVFARGLIVLLEYTHAVKTPAADFCTVPMLFQQLVIRMCSHCLFPTC
jgi:hypothetical protein